MTFTYTWANADCKGLRREDSSGNSAFVPTDPANADYQVFLAWCAEGNEPLPYIEPEKLPEPTLKDKLATVGITIEDLKAELGIA